MLLVLNFLIGYLFLDCFLIVRNPVSFLTLPFRSEDRQCSITKLVGLALSCIESAAVLRRRTDVWVDKDRELVLLQLCALRIVNGRIRHYDLPKQNRSLEQMFKWKKLKGFHLL